MTAQHATSAQAAGTATAPTAMGHSHAHESAQAQVRGAAPYVDDIPETAGTLHAAPVLSPVAHGTLHGLDTSAALALPGVVAVLTASDIPGDPGTGRLHAR
jgi:xanthine dehydrogenase large subunit